MPSVDVEVISNDVVLFFLLCKYIRCSIYIYILQINRNWPACSVRFPLVVALLVLGMMGLSMAPAPIGRSILSMVGLSMAPPPIGRSILSMVGLSMVGLSMVGLSMVVLSMVVLSMVGLSMAPAPIGRSILSMVGLSMARGLSTSASGIRMVVLP